MVGFTTLYVVALSLSVVLARPSHHLHAARSHKNVPSKKRACSAKNQSGNSTLASTSSVSVSSSSGSKNSTTVGSKSSSSGTSTSKSSGSSSKLSDTGVFPTNNTVVAGWTVDDDATLQNVQYFPLNNDTFILEKDDKTFAHPIVTEDGVPAMWAHFDKGAYELQTDPSILGGFSFYTPGPASSGTTPAVDLAALKAREVSYGYKVKFSSGFEYNKGGKLPGLFGGTSLDVADTCSGGQHAEGCFSTRMMWRPDGQGELYMYIPPDLNRANLCGPHGTSDCRAPSSNGLTYGASVGTGNFNFTSGAWTDVRQVVHLNTPGQTDGWAAVYVNGATDPAIYIDQISYGSADDTYFYGTQVQTFFGGHDPTWASPQAQDIWFSEFTVVVLSVFD